jgi:hypothetical protein
LHQLHPSLAAGLPSHRKKVNVNPLQRNEDDAFSAVTGGRRHPIFLCRAVWPSLHGAAGAGGKFCSPWRATESAKFFERASPEMKKLM